MNEFYDSCIVCKETIKKCLDREQHLRLAINWVESMTGCRLK